MMPFYRHMDSYPNHRNQMPFPQYYYPSNDGIPPNMMMDQAKSPMIYESWPHGSNHAYPMPFHPCGNHGNFPGYYNFQPPLPHFSPSPPHHCCGHHPSFSEQYPVHYPFPSHHWRYEYDKDMHRDFHCCGCPNHIHNQKDDKGVKIEEQEPDVKKPSDSLVPFQLKNHSYPMLWIPPEYMKKYNEHREPLESKVADQDTVSHSTKSHGNMRSSDWEPGIWNGWFPLDMNNLKSLVQGEDEKRLKNQQYDDKMKQLPFPFFCMPSKNEQEEAEKKGEGKMNGWFPLDASNMKSLMQGDDEKRQNQQNENQMRQFPYHIIWMSPDNSKPREGEKKDQKEANAAPMSGEEPHCSFKFVPVKPFENDDGMIKSKTNKEISGSQVKSSQKKESTANQKSIPVKQVEVCNEDNSEDCEKKVREITAKKAENTSTDSPSGTGTKRQSSSPPRMSKLPPVCLRLEPLSRKKNGNGSSRSPSPPSPKVRSQEASENTSNPSALTKVKGNSPRGTQAPDVSLKNDEEGEPQRYDKNAIDVVGAKTSEDKNDELNNGSQREISVNLPVNSQEVVSKAFSAETIGKDTDESKNEEDKRATCERDVMAESTTQAKIATGSAETADGSRARIKDLCDEEAATLIQSAYRAYEVRKLEPLKKLKQMAAVSEQLGEVKNRIQALESSDLENNDKERVVLGEMIMSLLLKLDTIQGLHPSLREFRKALAKELVTLQEKLDSLMMKRPKESFENVLTTKPADDPNIVTQNEVGIVENKLEASHDNDGNMAEQDKGLLVRMESVVSNSQGQKISEPSLTSTAVHGRCENQKELPVTTGENSIDSEMVSDLQVECEASHKELGGTQMSMAETKESDAVHPKLKQSVELPSISEEKTCSEELVNSLLQGSYCDLNRENEDKVVRHGDLIDESKELPAKILDGEHVVSELEKNKVAGEEHMFPSLPFANVEVGNVVPEADNDIGTDKDTETNVLTELPLGVIEVDLTLSASVEHEQIEKVKVEVPSSEEARFNMASNTTLPAEETSLDEIATDATSPMDEASSLNEAMQHSPKVELGDDAMVVTQELLRDAALENKQTEPSISTAREGNSDKKLNEERDHSMIDVNATPMLEAAVTSIATPESDEKKGDEQQQEPYGIEEEDLPEKKPQEEEPECTIDDNTMEERELNGNKEKGVLEHKPEYQQPECTNDDNKMDELPHQLEAAEWDVHVATPSSSRSIEEYGSMMERDKKLIEENVKLREMMEKLMEAGKEQLSVISSLTGRVKDLERKLSKKKRLRTSKHKKATPSITKLQNMKERAVDVAM